MADNDNIKGHDSANPNNSAGIVDENIDDVPMFKKKESLFRFL